MSAFLSSVPNQLSTKQTALLCTIFSNTQNKIVLSLTHHHHISIGTQQQRLTVYCRTTAALKKQAAHINYYNNVNNCRQHFYQRNWTCCLQYKCLALLWCYKGTVTVHITKAYVGVEVQLHSFLILALAQDEQSASTQAHLTPWKALVVSV